MPTPPSPFSRLSSLPRCLYFAVPLPQHLAVLLAPSACVERGKPGRRRPLTYSLPSGGNSLRSCNETGATRRPSPPPPPPSPLRPRPPTSISPPQNNRAPSRRQPCSADRSVAPYLASFGGSLGGIGCSASLPDQSTSLSILAVTKHFLAAHPLPSPNNIPILPWKADFVFFPPHHHLRHCCDCVAATKCPTTLAASRCRCRHSASSYRERPDPHAHRLRQATASTSRRNRNAHTRARFHRRLHHHHGHRRCVLMSTDPKAQAVWQTPRHRHQAASLATQR